MKTLMIRRLSHASSVNKDVTTDVKCQKPIIDLLGDLTANQQKSRPFMCSSCIGEYNDEVSEVVIVKSSKSKNSPTKVEEVSHLMKPTVTLKLISSQMMIPPQVLPRNHPVKVIMFLLIPNSLCRSAQCTSGVDVLILKIVSTATHLDAGTG